MDIKDKLSALGIALPPPIQVPAGIEIPFSWMQFYESRAYVSGHDPQNPDGSVAGPFGKVGAAVRPEQATAITMTFS